MLPEITIIHCFIPVYCPKGTKNIQVTNACRNYNYPLLHYNFLSKPYENHLTFKSFQKLQLSIALLQFTVKMALKTVNFQMLPETRIIHCFIATYSQNGS